MKIEKTEDFCCPVFSKLISAFNWYSLKIEEGKDAGEYLVMPIIKEDTTQGKFRVNNCPSCGKEIRNIQIKFELLNEIIK